MESATQHPDGPKWNVALFSGSPEDAVVTDQFTGRPEFIIHPTNGPRLLTLAELKALTLTAQMAGDDLLILSNTQHQFTAHYTATYLEAGISAAQKSNADILLGAVNWMESAVQVDQHLFWLDKFLGCQFIVLFRRCYNALLNIKIDGDNTEIAIDGVLSSILVNKLLLYPFISTVTEKIPKKNAIPGSSPYYGDPTGQLASLQQVKEYYSSINTAH
ncbi:hypothetical protein FHW36_104334 [Chitinophaga polysaccharea]|uniref:Uncharacterized protein n=1 Tax=Chitinophaga polysaccharea TaxID=1293035 RepID=A0A561PRD1_9BACT|nr:hypothetical protein [Chitinophaga polysaccharea]TWF40651.1 hypothetical protein FHW36_104334 [Chitinophaga polysaccharea]